MSVEIYENLDVTAVVPGLSRFNRPDCARELSQFMRPHVELEAGWVDEYYGYPEVQRSVALESLCRVAGLVLSSELHDEVLAEMKVEDSSGSF